MESDKIKKAVNTITHEGFFVLIILLIGIWLGMKGWDLVITNKINEAIKLGGLIHDNVVYDIKVRP